MAAMLALVATGALPATAGAATEDTSTPAPASPSTTAAPAPSTTTSTTAAATDPVAAPIDTTTVPAATTQASSGSGVFTPVDGVNTLAYAGAPWFKPGTAYTQNFPDPTVVWDPVGGRYWAYATSTGGSLVPAMSSTDLNTWVPRAAYSPNPYNGDPFFNDSFPVPPGWTSGGTSRTNKAQWAPGVVKLGSTWVMYTSWEVYPGRRCISVATSSAPQGPFVDPNPFPLVCDSDPGGSIDPEPFVDSSGQAYLLWKAAGVPGSAPTKIKSQPIGSDGRFLPGSSPTVLLQTELPWDGNSIENPSMVKYQGQYWLIYSGNEWESASYRMGQALCAGPSGPCGRTSASPLIENTATQWSPGGGSMFVDQAGRLRIIYQYWNAPYTSYPTNPNCDGNGTCTSQGQRFYRIDGLTNYGGRLSIDPVGSLDVATVSNNSVSVGGWAVDPSSAGSIPVHVYVDNVGVALNASGSRPDLASLFPGLGTAHGYSGTIATTPGNHTVCAYGINVGAGTNTVLGCRSVFVPGTVPFGSLDMAVGIPGAVQVGGWAIDPDTQSSIQVHVYVDSVGTAVTASGSRPDLATAFPGYGTAHGFNATIPASPGLHTVCAYGINVGAGTNSGLGCKVVLVPTGPPFGSLDLARGTPGGVLVGGWAIDPDTSASIQVHVYVDSAGAALVASGSRPDVGAAFPGYGSSHGFGATLAAAPGIHTVCAYAINVGTGSNTGLGCQLVLVPWGPPFGSFDVATGVSGGVFVGGWAIDPDTSASIQVHVYVDSAGTALVASGNRPDLAAAFPGYGAAHGFGTTVAASKGTHTVCAYAINVGIGANSGLGCRVVTVP
jgi:hypothetical protein